MHKFYRFAGVTALALVMITGAGGWFVWHESEIKRELLPRNFSVHPWQLHASSDHQKGGQSSITVNDANHTLDYSFTLSPQIAYPFANIHLAFDEMERARVYTDLSDYSAIRLELRCNAKTDLMIQLNTFDQKTTKPDQFMSYRISEALLDCGREWAEVTIDFESLYTPLWWLNHFERYHSEQQFDLTRTLAISFHAPHYSRVQQETHVTIVQLTLISRNWWFIGGFIILAILSWVVGIFWILKKYTATLLAVIEAELSHDKPLMAFSRLSVVRPADDSALTKLLHYMATEYSNDQLSLAQAASHLGINRTKINELLKKELGLTFIAYLTKLRLAEAARILGETEELAVTTVAYKVGYNDVSYFIKKFKAEYGCTPKNFSKSFDHGDGKRG